MGWVNVVCFRRLGSPLSKSCVCGIGSGNKTRYRLTLLNQESSQLLLTLRFNATQVLAYVEQPDISFRLGIHTYSM